MSGPDNQSTNGILPWFFLGEMPHAVRVSRFRFRGLGPAAGRGAPELSPAGTIHRTRFASLARKLLVYLVCRTDG